MQLWCTSDGSWLATVGDGTARIWDVVTGRQRNAAPTDPSGKVNALAITPDGSWLISGCSDGTVRFRDAATGRERILTGHRKGGVNAVAVAPGGEWLATGGGDGTVRIWKAPARRHRGGTAPPRPAPTGPYRTVLTRQNGPVTAVAIAPDGRWLVISGPFGTARITDAPGPRQRTVLAGIGDRLYPMVVGRAEVGSPPLASPGGPGSAAGRAGDESHDHGERAQFDAQSPTAHSHDINHRSDSAHSVGPLGGVAVGAGHDDTTVGAALAQSGHVLGIARSVETRTELNSLSSKRLSFWVYQREQQGDRPPPVAVHVRGGTLGISGQLTEGDEVEVWGRRKSGVLQAAGLLNLSTGTRVFRLTFLELWLSIWHRNKFGAVLFGFFVLFFVFDVFEGVGAILSGTRAPLGSAKQGVLPTAQADGTAGKVCGVVLSARQTSHRATLRERFIHVSLHISPYDAQDYRAQFVAAEVNGLTWSEVPVQEGDHVEVDGTWWDGTLHAGLMSNHTTGTGVTQATWHHPFYRVPVGILFVVFMTAFDLILLALLVNALVGLVKSVI